MSYLPYDPKQILLLPPALQEWLPDDHLAYYINDTVDLLDLSAFHLRYAGGGPRNQPFDPSMMVKVLIYAYATGVFSSRKIARRLHEDVAFRVLAAGNFPKHRTLCDFRANHLKELTALFIQVVRLARECGLVRLGAVAVDGTKIKANASRHKAMSYQRMREEEAVLLSQVKALLDRAQAADQAERNEPELDIPAEIRRREDRLSAIRAARARLEERQAEDDRRKGRDSDDDRRPKGKSGKPARGARYKRDFGVPRDEVQESFTDPDSRIMKRSGGGFDQSYNAHTAVDAQAQIIVAAELSNNASDSDRLPVLLDAVEANLGDTPATVVADTGFRSEAVFGKLSGSRSKIIVALGREGREQVKVDAARYPHTASMAALLQTDEGKASYRRRKAIVEPPNGWIKNILGFRQFSLRGLDKVQAEFRLVCMALNLRRMSYLRAT